MGFTEEEKVRHKGECEAILKEIGALKEGESIEDLKEYQPE